MAPIALLQNYDESTTELPFEAFKDSPSSLPFGFPKRVFTEAAWEPDSPIVAPASYIHRLSNEDLVEIHEALVSFECSGAPLNEVSKATFQLPGFESKLADSRNQIQHGRGFVLFRGIDAEKHSLAQLAIIHAGLASYIGDKRGMSGGEGGDKTVLHHITHIPDPPPSSNAPYHGPPNRNKSLPLHTDLGDIITLFTARTPSIGGSFLLASTSTIYNALASLRPSIIHTLASNWTFESPSPTSPSTTRPLLYYHNSRLLLNISLVRIIGTPERPRPAFLPPLSAAQREALKVVEELGREMCVRIDFEEGDLLAFDNRRLVHGRERFVDEVEGGKQERKKKRHLLRLIVRNKIERGGEGTWEDVPVQLREVWKAVYEHESGEEQWPLKEERFSFMTSH